MALYFVRSVLLNRMRTFSKNVMVVWTESYMIHMEVLLMTIR